MTKSQASHNGGAAPTARTPGGFPAAERRLVSFDSGVACRGVLQRPDRYKFWTPDGLTGPLIPRGAGLSYAAASFGPGARSIEHGAFNRVLGFDRRQGVVEVEAGISLGALYDFLASRGLFLPVQPGHGRISVGGCVAADVHGKNHAQDGTFINQVVGLTLFHPAHGLLELTPEKETDLFRLTCGGFGLTGNIIKVRLRASPIPSPWVEMEALPVEEVGDGLAQLRRAASQADFAYTWQDFTRQVPHFGKGYLFLARFVPGGQEPGSFGGPGAYHPPRLSAQERAAGFPPLLNCWSTRALNLAYDLRQKVRGRTVRLSLRQALFPIEQAQSYFKLFGGRGFHEYQALLPAGRMEHYLDQVRRYLSRRQVAVTLASAKLFKGRPELLRFTGDGVCFALNLPRTAGSPAFLAFLDGLLVELGGIPNIIKDSRLPRAVVEACYPEVERFRGQLRAFDPRRLYRSELSGRLGL